ncbi:MAG: DUF4240 domain-containing protein [Chitinophagaceae bacterium]
MGLFDKLFGRTNQPADTTGLTKTAEMLEEKTYWDIVDRSLKYRDDQDRQEQFLIAEIGKLTPRQMIGFRLRTDKLLYDTHTSAMWCAGYIMNGGCSDDGFEYFRNWVISRGKQVYDRAMVNPDNLVSEANEDLDVYEFETFWYVANEAFRQKTGKDLYDYIDDEIFKTNEAHYPPVQFTWQEDDPASMKKICPNLFARFMGEE